MLEAVVTKSDDGSSIMEIVEIIEPATTCPDMLRLRVDRCGAVDAAEASSNARPQVPGMPSSLRYACRYDPVNAREVIGCAFRLP